MFILQLNDMRSSQIQILTSIIRSESKEALLTFVENEKAEPYQDGRWRKCFKQGGPLEWFNPFIGVDAGVINAGTAESWQEDALEMFTERVLSVPKLT